MTPFREENLHIEYSDLQGTTAEDIFARLVRKGNGGVKVRSAAAPALSTQFVKSKMAKKATAESEGAFAEIIYPSRTDQDKRMQTLYGKTDLFGYSTTQGSVCNPAGFGERSAHALAREDTIYQLKGTFSSAVVSYTKLRARLEARQGDVRALDTVFSSMWGLESGATESIPKLHLVGSEATRLSAMEDRAYHSLSGHPGHNGGYRVDITTIPPDALGEDVPLNWPRMRTGIKAIALAQIQGDPLLASAIRKHQEQTSFTFAIDLAQGSQRAYVRPRPWEALVERFMTGNVSDDLLPAALMHDEEHAMHTPYEDPHIRVEPTDARYRLQDQVTRMAAIVSSMSIDALEKTTKVIMANHSERALQSEFNEEEFTEVYESKLSQHYFIPRYKLTSSALTSALRVPFIGKDTLPDMRSHGIPHQEIDLSEFREAKLTVPIDVMGAINLATHIICFNKSVRVYAYMLMMLVPAPANEEATYYKTSVRLRKQRLYEHKDVRGLGKHLFGDAFVAILSMLFKNMVVRSNVDERSIKLEIWDHLSGRTTPRRKCPFSGSWKDLIGELRTAPEGWSLYYWVRVSIGRQHFNISSGILAPMAAGEVVDFLTLMKRSIHDKAKHWAQYYSAKYRVIEDALMTHDSDTVTTEGVRAYSLRSDQVERYIPPHARRLAQIEAAHMIGEIESEASRASHARYQAMVEYQSKSKFFSSIRAFSKDEYVVVGISDEKMRDMLIEFYQTRWASLDHRIKKMKERGKTFRLGRHEFSTHPWGELIDVFPDTYEEMLDIMCRLDARAWTVDPRELQRKFRKSISELWEDIGQEIQTISDYVREMYNDRLADMEEADAQSELKRLLLSTAGIPAIDIPSFGYRLPSSMPVKSTIVYEGDRPKQISHSAQSFVTAPPMSDVCEEESDYEEMEYELDEDLYEGLTASADCDMTAIKQDFLSLRDIWHILAMPAVEDPRMRFALAVDSVTDLDAPHVNSELAPLISRGEEQQTHRLWKHRVPGMMHRLGYVDTKALEDDM